MAKSNSGGGGRGGGGGKAIASSRVRGFLSDLDRYERGSANSRAKLFAGRARQAVVNVYQPTDWSQWRTSPLKPAAGASPEALARANRLIRMGASEAVLGTGRQLLEKR